MHSKSDSAFQFQLVLVVPNATAELYTSPSDGSCATMGIRNFGIAIYNTLSIRYVMFNGSLVDYSTEADGVNGTFVYLELDKAVTDFDINTPIDVVITVRGQVDSLCPSNAYFYTGNACEYVIHGREPDTDLQCCPHGLTRGASALDTCCIDNLPQTPYRVEYLETEFAAASTTFDFALELVAVTVNEDYEDLEGGLCNTMTLDYASIQIYTGVDVQQVVFDGRIMSFNTTYATKYSVWLNINGINRFTTDFDINNPTPFEVTVAGTVREPCPGTNLFKTPGVTCEYALHGRQSASTCCPIGLTQPGTPIVDCGCRDDLSQTPFELGYDLATPAANAANTTFAFNIDVVSATSLDFDGMPDALNGSVGAPDVDCSAMGLKAINFAIYTQLTVVQVTVGGFVYDFQTVPNNNGSQWLTILDVDYSVSDFATNANLFVMVTVAGAVSELCPASSFYGSQAACEYYLFGLGALYAECCPHGVSAWTGLALPTSATLYLAASPSAAFSRGL